MRITIITPTYNSASYLQDCINSVKNQTYKEIEYIVVDGKSTDGTIDLLMKNQDAIAKFISEPDKGMYDAINKGLAMATGDVVGILNSDDMFAAKDVVETIVHTFRSRKCDSVYGDLNIVRPENTNKIYRVWRSCDYDRKRFLWGWMPPHPTFYIKKNLIDEFGGFENHFYSAADYEFMCRYLYKHKISAVYIPKLMIKMRSGGQSNGSIKRRLRANRRDYLAMKKNGLPFPFISSILKPLLKLHQYGKAGVANKK